MGLRAEPIKPKVCNFFFIYKFLIFFSIFALQPVESMPEKDVSKSQASSSKPPEIIEPSSDEVEKIKEESQSWKQKYQAKSVSEIKSFVLH